MFVQIDFSRESESHYALTLAYTTAYGTRDAYFSGSLNTVFRSVSDFFRILQSQNQISVDGMWHAIATLEEIVRLFGFEQYVTHPSELRWELVPFSFVVPKPSRKPDPRPSPLAGARPSRFVVDVQI